MKGKQVLKTTFCAPNNFFYNLYNLYFIILIVVYIHNLFLNFITEVTEVEGYSQFIYLL